MPASYNIDSHNKEVLACLAQAAGVSASEYLNRMLSQIFAPEYGPTILSLVNRSSKSGKTTAATYLPIMLGAHGKQVLVVDLDFQGRASMKLLGKRYEKLKYGILDTLKLDAQSNNPLLMENIIISTRFDNVWIAPNAFFSPSWKHTDGYHLEHEYTMAYYWHLQLRNALEQVRGNFDFIIVDCPSDFGPFTKMGIEAQWAGSRTSRVVIPWRGGEWRLPSPAPVLERIDEISKGHGSSGARSRILYQNILSEFPEKYPGVPHYSAMGEMESPAEHEEGNIVESLFKSWELVAREVVADVQESCFG